MLEELINNDLAKEVITVLTYSDDEITNKIPDNILKYLNDLASASSKEFHLYKDKKLLEQNISNECKNILSILYISII